MNKVEVLKAQYANDVFTTEAEARVRSRDLGYNGEIHAYDYEGQRVYIPGESHEEYLGEEAEEYPKDIRMEALRMIIEEILKGEPIEGRILKVDDEQRIIYGWASVVTVKGEPVIDHQGDVIKADTLVKAVNEFMEHVRVGKTMHEGEETGKVIHSLPITKEIADALGIQCDREGWVVAYKVYDDDVWKRVKSGELRAFSIGGRATKEDYIA